MSWLIRSKVGNEDPKTVALRESRDRAWQTIATLWLFANMQGGSAFQVGELRRTKDDRGVFGAVVTGPDGEAVRTRIWMEEDDDA